MKIADSWKSFQMILDGWKNLIVRNPIVEAHAIKRLNICVKCKYNSTKPDINLTSICKECRCVLEAKSRNLESQCPKRKWLKVDQEMK